VTHEELILRAAGARERAVAPISGFRVGAALLATSGRVFEGCNIENSTLNLGLCAERVALAAALAAGERDFEALAIVAEGDEPASPCGSCRQLLWEFAGDLLILSGNLSGKVKTFSLACLLPSPFGGPFRPEGERGSKR
jgi:cytidine deaminase